MRHLYLLCLLLGFAPTTLIAQTDSSAAAQTLQRYDIEIIIFKNVKAPKSREFVLPVSSPTKTAKMLDLSSPSSVNAARKLGYEVLPSNEFRLLEVLNKLVESPRYQLLTHIAWRQPGIELEQAIPIWIKGGKIFGNEYTSIDSQIELLESLPADGSNDDKAAAQFEFDEQTLEALELQLLERQQANRHQGLYELEGKITISLSRYLHASTELVLRRPRLSVDAIINPTTQDRYLAAYSADTRILDNHLLRERRRMRSKNLHYLDNPEFALLILITPYEESTQAKPTAEE